MTGADWGILVAVVILFLFSIFLAASETAFTRMSRIRALTLQEEGVKGAGRLARMLERPEQTLNVVLLLVLVAQLTSASLLGALLERSFGSAGLFIGLVLQILVYFVIGEVAPKTYAIQNPDRAALRLSGFLWAITNFPPLRVLSRGLIGLANVLLPGKGLKQGPFVTEEDLRAMADVAADEDVIEREERRLIHSIFEFGDTVVREVMRPRPDMIAVDASETIESAIEMAIEAGFSRLPCFEETTDNIVGIVYLKDLVHLSRAGRGQEPAQVAVRDAVFVPEQKRVAELLREMRTQKFHMAMVVDEYGGTAGLVTLEDLLEEIVGEIVDEYDTEEPGVERLANGGIRAPGRTPIDELNEALGIELPDTEWDTVGGLVFNLLGHVPEAGECVKFQGLEFRTEKVEGRRIASVAIVPATNGTGEGNGAPAGTRERGRARQLLSVAASGFRSGFVSLVGRPNVGKSTLVNRIVGSKVSIVSSRPQTTRTQVRGVRTTPESQLVLLDTPGIHKPRTLLGERCNSRSVQTLAEVDVVCLVVEATAVIGGGDRFISALVHEVDTPRVLVLNKVDAATPTQIADHLGRATAELGEFDAFVPVSARTGDGVDALVAELESRLPEGPVYYPDGEVTDQPETALVAELLREKLLAVTRDELPHSIVVTAEPLDDDEHGGPGLDDEADPILRYLVVVRVERDSQKGIVIGKGGRVIRDAGTAARRELEVLLGARVYLETKVRVDPDWQRRAHALDRLGL